MLLAVASCSSWDVVSEGHSIVVVVAVVLLLVDTDALTSAREGCHARVGGRPKDVLPTPKPGFAKSDARCWVRVLRNGGDTNGGATKDECATRVAVSLFCPCCKGDTETPLEVIKGEDGVVP